MGYYVSVVDRDRSSLLLGPFNRHGDALRMVHTVAGAARRVDNRAAWYRFGTCRVAAGSRGDDGTIIPPAAGRLNKMLGFPTDGTRLTLPDPARYVVNPRSVLHGSGPPPPGFVTCDGARPGCTTDDSHFHQLQRQVA